MESFITVTDLNNYITDLLQSDEFLADFWIKGEISGFKWYRKSGHMYFTLKDANSSISCVMFKSRNRNLKFQPEDGLEVLIRGYVSLFAPQGRYQLYVEEIHPYGIGGLYQHLEKLKQKLSQAGYFDPGKKKPVPKMVNRVGIVTSQDGAALRDIIRVLRQRHPNVEIVLVNSSVQGTNAPQELVSGLLLLNEHSYVEVIIIGRGGGSFEDLMAFNNEEVVKAVFNSQIPVISAVGHEVDFSLCDLAADIRAATPTQAAQIAVPDLLALNEKLVKHRQRLEKAISRRLSYQNEGLDRIMMKKIWQEPGSMLKGKNETVINFSKALHRNILAVLKEKGNQFSVVVTALDNLSPMKTIARGYAVLHDKGRVIKSVEQVSIGGLLQATLQDGDIEVEIKSKEKIARWKV